jgi:hypothetical protein
MGALDDSLLAISRTASPFPSCVERWINPLHATIEEFVAEGFTHIECHCPRCRVTRLRQISWLPRISMGLAISQLSARLRCAKCGGPVSVGQAVAIGVRVRQAARSSHVRNGQGFA